MDDDRSVSVIVPAYNEEATIASVVTDFVSHPKVGEVLVVDNNCTDRTAELAHEAGARVVAESDPGYGRALMCGMRAAVGERLSGTHHRPVTQHRDTLRARRALRRRRR